MNILTKHSHSFIKTHLIILIIFAILFGNIAPIKGQGLRFIDKNTNENHTVLNIQNDKSPIFNKKLSIEFDLEIYDYHTVGQIFRIKDKKKLKEGDYVLVYSYCDPQKSIFQFNLDKKQCHISDTILNTSLGPGHWLHFKIELNFTNKNLILGINGKQKSSIILSSSNQIQPQIYFGSKSYEEQFAAMSIKNLKIYDDNKKYEYPLNESSGSIAHNISESNNAKVYPKGEWLINRSCKWVKRFSYHSSTVAAVNYNTDDNSIIILNKDSLIVYTPFSENLTQLALPQSMPINSKLGTSYYIPKDTALCIYEVNNLPLGTTTSAKLNLHNLKWEILSTDYISTQRHHHASFIDNSGLYTIFGGFGNRKYSNEFVEFNDSSKKWQILHFHENIIEPRFATSIGHLNNNKYLIYGGMGNPSGEEMMGLIYYDDLYEVDMQSKSIKQKWKIKTDNYNQVPVRNLLVKDSTFYTLRYPIKTPDTHLKLYEISIENGKRKQVGDSIPINSTSILTNANIYENKDRGELYCVIQEFHNDNELESIISVYSINTPVYPINLLHSSKAKINFFYIFTIIAIIIIFPLAIIIKRKRKNIEKNNSNIAFNERNDLKQNAIYFFGEFKMYDKNGKDITYMFSAKLYQLFIIILYYTARKEGGVSSTLIADFLWPEKDSQSVKNIKGVTLNKLRGILKEFDSVKIIYENGVYSLTYSENFYCDFKELCDLLNNQQKINTSLYKNISDILNRGEIFSGNKYGCLTIIKDEFINEITSLFISYLEDLFKEHKYSEILKITDIILKFDTQNKSALIYQIICLRKTNRKDLSIKKYQQFKINYNKENGEEFPDDYESLIKSFHK